MQRPLWTTTCASAVLLTLVAGATDTAAQQRRPGAQAYGEQWVTAESRFGKGVISAPVRHGPRGPEVRLPGGSWIDCGRSCRNTLRAQTVDFWENQGGPQAKDGSPGYFQWHYRY